MVPDRNPVDRAPLGVDPQQTVVGRVGDPDRVRAVGDPSRLAAAVITART